MIDEQSYLMAKASKRAWEQSCGTPSVAIAILAERMRTDATLRQYIAEVIISDIAGEVSDRIGRPEGCA